MLGCTEAFYAIACRRNPTREEIMRFLVHSDLPPKGVNYSPQHIKRLVAQGKFPRPVKGVCKENAWPEPAIDQYVAMCIAAADAALKDLKIG